MSIVDHYDVYFHCCIKENTGYVLQVNRPLSMVKSEIYSRRRRPRTSMPFPYEQLQPGSSPEHFQSGSPLDAMGFELEPGESPGFSQGEPPGMMPLDLAAQTRGSPNIEHDMEEQVKGRPENALLEPGQIPSNPDGPDT